MKKEFAPQPLISLVVPVYNEEESVNPFLDKVVPIISAINENWEIIFVNDGSKDKTYEKLAELGKNELRIKIINFSRNFGKEAALTAGLDYAKGRSVVPMDVDLQDPPELISEMYKKWQEGYKVVLAVRKKRNEPFFKRFSASMFYKTMSALSDVDIPYNVGDYRLMDEEVVKVIRLLPEKTRFMKGILAWAGFSTASIYFDRPPRFAGKPVQNYRKLFRLAIDGIFSFSTAPLRVWTYIGFAISFLAMCYAVLIVARTLYYGIDLPGYASLMTVILFIGGIQLISLGVLGEYIGRIYRETKNRPIYVVENPEKFDN